MLLLLGCLALQHARSVATRTFADPYNCIVVLGQSLNADKSVPPVLRARVLAATELHAKHPEAMLVVTGGDPVGVGQSEASIMTQLLTSAGVARANIVLEDQSQNTVQNALLSLPLIPTSAQVLHLVTSDFHMPRAAYIFNAAIEAAGRSQQLRLRSHPVPMHNMSGHQSQETSEINSLDRTQRLLLELRMLHDDVVQRHLPSHGDTAGLGFGPLAPLPQAQLQIAIDEVRAMLEELRGHDHHT
jgi:hypothetical protein